MGRNLFKRHGLDARLKHMNRGQEHLIGVAVDMYKFGIGIQIVKHPHFCSVVRAFEQDALSLAKIGDFLEQVFVGGTPALLLGVGHAVFKSQIHILLIALRKGDQVGKGLIDTVGDGIALFLGRMGQKLHIVAKAVAG